MILKCPEGRELLPQSLTGNRLTVIKTVYGDTNNPCQRLYITTGLVEMVKKIPRHPYGTRESMSRDRLTQLRAPWMVSPRDLILGDGALLYIAYVMLVWAAPIPADRWNCSLWS